MVKTGQEIMDESGQADTSVGNDGRPTLSDVYRSAAGTLIDFVPVVVDYMKTTDEKLKIIAKVLICVS